MALIYVVLIDFDLCCSETAKVKILTPMCLIYAVEERFKMDQICHFSPGKN